MPLGVQKTPNGEKANDGKTVFFSPHFWCFSDIQGHLKSNKISPIVAEIKDLMGRFTKLNYNVYTII